MPTDTPQRQAFIGPDQRDARAAVVGNLLPDELTPEQLRLLRAMLIDNIVADVVDAYQRGEDAPARVA